MQTYNVLAHWDGEARVWWAESGDVKGLVAEAGTIEGLMEDLRELVPELLRLNHQIETSQRVNIHLVADRTEGVPVPA
jgi:predicted RNase H-like HicB family nuclease